MKYHPDVLAVHAEFGGDLQSMQALYDRPDHIARIAALEAQLAERVKVKALEWRDKSGSEYEVRCDGVGIGAHYVAKAVKCGDLILCCGKYHSDINKAKAAAQADFERRILDALEATPPAPKVTADTIDELRWIMQNLPVEFAMHERCPTDTLMHVITTLSAAQEASK